MTTERFSKGKIDVEANLKRYVPNIFKLLEPERISWSRVSHLYQKELMRRIEIINQTGQETLIVETTFLDMITQLLNGKEHYYNLYRFINDMIFADFIQLMTLEERKLIKKTIYNLLTTFNRNYLHYVGELASLWKFKKAGYSLIRVEELMDDEEPDKARIDFTLIKESRGYFVEVVNIHLSDSNTLTPEIIGFTINGKIEKKIKTFDESKKPIYLNPVLWGTYEELKKVYEWFIKNPFKRQNILGLNAFASYEANNGEQMVRFGAIAGLMPLIMTDENIQRL
jgi:hypothetical protein